MDFPHDTGFRTWMELADNHSDLIPSYVMGHEPEKMASDAVYADDFRNLFPIGTPAETWLSAAYLTKAASDGRCTYAPAEFGHVSDMVARAAAIHGVSDDVAAITGRLAAKEADAEPCYLWTVRDDSGAVLARKYPVFDADGVKRAAGYFAENRARYPLDVRVHIATGILRKAAEFGVDVKGLPGEVRREAGFGVPNIGEVSDELNWRAKMASDSETALAVLSLAEGIATTAGLGTDILWKIAGTLEEFDRGSGLDMKYGREVRMPADFLFAHEISKTAEALDDAVVLGKSAFSARGLSELPAEVFTEVLGDDILADITVGGRLDAEKLAAVLPALPLPDRHALEDFLRDMYA